MGFLLPLESASRVLLLFIIELRLPPPYIFLECHTETVLGMTVDTVARNNVIVEPLLEPVDDGVAINRDSQVWPLKSLGEDSEAFMRVTFSILFSSACV